MSPARNQAITIGDYTIVEVDAIPPSHRDGKAVKVVEFLHAHPGVTYKLFESPERNAAYGRYSTLKRIATRRYGDSIVLRVRTHDGVSAVYGAYLPERTLSEWDEVPA